MRDCSSAAATFHTLCQKLSAQVSGQIGSGICRPSGILVLPSSPPCWRIRLANHSLAASDNESAQEHEHLHAKGARVLAHSGLCSTASRFLWCAKRANLRQLSIEIAPKCSKDDTFARGISIILSGLHFSKAGVEKTRCEIVKQWDCETSLKLARESAESA
jgi:hypothetical protein